MQVDFKPGGRLGAAHSDRAAKGITSALRTSLFARLSRRANQSLGAVQVTQSDDSAARRNMFVLGAGCIAGGAMIFLINTVEDISGGLPGTSAKPTAFKQAILNLPKPLPSPTFRFDDADAAIQHEAIAGFASPRLNPSQTEVAFTPQAFADLLGPDDESAFEHESLLEDIRNAERDLPPLRTALPHQTLEVIMPDDESEESGLQDDVMKVVEVQGGDTFSNILNDNGISRADLPALEEHELVERYLTRLKVGQKMDFLYGWQGDFKSLNVKVSRDTRVVLAKTDEGYSIEKIHLPLEHERVVTSGTIDQSLYVAAEKANLKQTTIMNLADIFQWELDFSNDIRKGDHFSIIYDRLYRDGKYIGDGDILAAEFVRGSRVHRAIRHTDEEGHTNYYAPDGKPKGRTFMRHPVDIVRITSKFNLKRMHPVLHQIRAHKGVDYGSPYGSPIRAVADGEISFSGDRSAYGKTVIIKHDAKRTTLYAHMSNIDSISKVGKKVKRGDVIGYVGRTGRVTGTHLHYELRIDGVHVDPLKVELPSPKPLATAELKKLKVVSTELLAQMRSVNDIQAVASNQVKDEALVPESR